MPVKTQVPIRRLSQPEFASIAYEVMHHVFAVHNEMGRLFHETIYKRALAQRLPELLLEVPIDIVFETFRKRYYLDMLYPDGALFEVKAVQNLTERHVAQSLNYLLLCNLAHGKLINMQRQSVEHQFVNTRWHLDDRRNFNIDRDRWDARLPGAARLEELLVSLLRDIGTGLELALYQEAMVHFFGGMERVEGAVRVQLDQARIGDQPMRLIAPDVAMKITGFDEALSEFETQARRMLAHVQLRAILWVNINMWEVTFTSLKP